VHPIRSQFHTDGVGLIFGLEKISKGEKVDDIEGGNDAEN